MELDARGPERSPRAAHIVLVAGHGDSSVDPHLSVELVDGELDGKGVVWIVTVAARGGHGQRAREVERRSARAIPASGGIDEDVSDDAWHSVRSPPVVEAVRDARVDKDSRHRALSRYETHAVVGTLYRLHHLDRGDRELRLLHHPHVDRPCLAPTAVRRVQGIAGPGRRESDEGSEVPAATCWERRERRGRGRNRRGHQGSADEGQIRSKEKVKRES